jgi:hypothetical protein
VGYLEVNLIGQSQRRVATPPQYRRKFKSVVRQDRSERMPEVYRSQYVEGLSDARTPAAAAFNILLGTLESSQFRKHNRCKGKDQPQ